MVYTHDILVADLDEIKKWAEESDIELSENPSLEEIQDVFLETFSEMSDPWEITANGECKIEVIEKNTSEQKNISKPVILTNYQLNLIQELITLGLNEFGSAGGWDMMPSNITPTDLEELSMQLTK